MTKGLTIQELLSQFEKGSVSSVQCINSSNPEGNDLFRIGQRYKVTNEGVIAHDGNGYNNTKTTFGNPGFKSANITANIKKPEDSGGSCDYYKVNIENPTSEDNWDKCTESAEYVAECNDIIEALDMTYAEANIFKEIWRSAAARTLGKIKAGHSEQRGAEKIEFFAKRNSIQKGVKQ